ncbi:free fatty acid receptor 4-like [Ostrea edulis]|uniref:free fatty acid receptor 4-like n=1 Tax=Ostrea edulis TaxID=37623 RepID=UPI0020944CE1|nr:free fatty acid receptor 4-like [Ostrea edulis]XP_048764992.1 free fatty acid receptor 4-like [Ostrea edulis]XP_056004519.1 free fatty acid receptor 4-like [Ostrea edulis]
MSQKNKSYFVAFDDEYGWGNTTYFSFFSEFNRSWNDLPYIEAFVLIFLFLFSILGNCIVFYQIMKLRSTRTVTNYLIGNLAVADILFSTGSPLIAVARMTGTWVLGSFVCKMLVYEMFICASVMIWTMTIISVDRYICILKTDWKKITPIVAICSIVILWILDFIAFIPLAMYFNVKNFTFGNTEITLCTLLWPTNQSVRLSMLFTATVCIIGFVIPLGILAFSYFRILRKFWKTRHAVGSAVKSIKCREERDFRLIKNLILMVLLFLVMWLPIFVMMALIQADGMADDMAIPSYALIAAVCVALGNACVNPFLYGIVNGRVKRGILRSVLSQKKKFRISTIDSKTDNSRVGHT